MSDLLAPAFLEESAADLYENAPCGYLSTLPDGTIVKLNGTFLRWTGFDRDALIGDRRFQQLLTVAGRVFHETHLTPLLLVEGQASEIALDLVCANGKRLPTLVNIVQHKDTDGRPRVNRLTVFNARRRRKYERELVAERRRAEHAAQVKTDFLSTISHEIRTPLGAIMAVTHLLERTSPNARQAKLLRMQRSSSDSLLKLVNEVLDFSKIEAGQVALEPAPFSV
ncbi:MAG: PAS domain S-box-containing protein, partial [Myxococcota bacterium]